MTVPSTTPSGPPPLNLLAVRQARTWLANPSAAVPTREAALAEIATLERHLDNLLRAYDALAARMAWLAASTSGDPDR